MLIIETNKVRQLMHEHPSCVKFITYALLDFQKGELAGNIKPGLRRQTTDDVVSIADLYFDTFREYLDRYELDGV